MARDLTLLSDRLEQYLASSGRLALFRQSQARRIMVEIGTSREDLPNFADRLDERLHFGSHFLINGGLELLESPEFRSQGGRFLFAGAEGLECLVGSVETYHGSIQDERLRCAAAYYLAGFHARAFVILNRVLLNQNEIGYLEFLVAMVLKQDVSGAHKAVTEIYSDLDYADEGMAAAIQRGELGLDGAINRVAVRVVAGAVGLFLEYLRTGAERYQQLARNKIEEVINLAQTSRFVDIWWWSKVLLHLLHEIGDTSLWSALAPILPAGSPGSYVRSYIVAAQQQNVCTLWPSQLEAVAKIVAPERLSLCVRMPTSAGKTRIAELAILTAFQDYAEENPKCIYIVPFRSLAVEVEHTLRSAFGPLGFTVSELYGGHTFGEVESRITEEVNIIIATPEKVDAMMRFAPTLFESIRCIIVDEGQTIGDKGERGLRAEFILHRLMRLLPRERCRYVFASAFLPNQEDFATWIGGCGEAAVNSDWRPTRQMVGEVCWQNGTARINYTHAGRKGFGTPCFVPRFIEQIVYTKRGREKKYPHEPREAVALSAVRLSVQGTVLLFVPQRQHVESTAEDVLLALKVDEEHNSVHNTGHLTVDLGRPEVSACLEAIKQERGDNSSLEECVHRGIAIHHGQLPRLLRQAIERFIASGQAQIIIATTSLAAGVNLPIRTVLVKGLWTDKANRIDARTFWNICGRAGRAMKEVEGQILFFMDLDLGPNRTARQVNSARKYNRTLIGDRNDEFVASALYRMLKLIREKWVRQMPDIGFDGICVRLANNDFNWIHEEEDRTELKNCFERLDEQLFAVLEEGLEDGELADLLQEVMTGSLLSVQLASQPIQDVDLNVALKTLMARLDYVKMRVPERAQRSIFYKLGLPIADCIMLDKSRDFLVEHFTQLNDWNGWDSAKRGNWLGLFVEWAATLPFSAVEPSDVASYVALTKQWMLGFTILELSKDRDVAKKWKKPDEVATAVEKFCDYRLSWLANAVVTYLPLVTAEEFKMPAVATALPAMFKYGTVEPLVTILAPFAEHDRRLAEALSSVCPFEVGAREVYRWLREQTVQTLVMSGLDPALGARLISARDKIFRTSPADDVPQHTECTVQFIGEVILPVEDSTVLALPDSHGDARIVELLSIDGIPVGRARPNHEILDIWFQWNRCVLTLRVGNQQPILAWATVA